MEFKEYLKNSIVFLDGGMGALLQDRGLEPGEDPERWNITHPEVIVDIHKEYYDAGANVVYTNTFGANGLKFTKDELREIVVSAVRNANEARKKSKAPQEKFVALDLGPCGRLLKPYGDFEFEDCVELFADIVRMGKDEGVDLVVVETMNDSYETKAALLAVKENCDLPVMVSNAYGEDMKLMTGASPEAMVAMLEGMGVAALGANCSLGPDLLMPVAERLIASSSLPVIVKPNAGIPVLENGETKYNVTDEEFADLVATMVKKGARLVGGCCGTTPEYIKKIVAKANNLKPVPVEKKNETVISSYTHALKIGEEPLLIGERINPTGKKRFKQALMENDITYILNEGIKQEERGAHILDVNVGLADIDEKSMLEEVVKELQAIINLPLQIDTADVDAMERALRCYNGKALINSVNGKEEVMEKVFPLAKKYGGAIICLTLDEKGIPETKEGRVEIAKRIIKKAESYGIEKKDLIFDTLTLTVSADKDAPKVTLEALKEIKDELKCNTSLGVSNVSFGLPERDAINSAFFLMALENGLSLAIMNPLSDSMMKAYYSFKALKGMDNNCEEYLSFMASRVKEEAKEPVTIGEETSLEYAILKGLKEKASGITKELLKTEKPLDIVNGHIIPALDEVGKGFEAKKIFLPQLLMSAEAAQEAFGEIKSVIPKGASSKGKKIVVATVKGDIHDIGKNIVKLLLENYGFDVVDLGKDVPEEKVVETLLNEKAEFVGLSALMTTTLPAMENTIKLIREKAPLTKIVVGGAVLNEEYAKKIGSDKYAKDAMETVRFLEETK